MIPNTRSTAAAAAAARDSAARQGTSEHSIHDHNENDSDAESVHSNSPSLSTAPSTIRPRSLSIPIIPDFRLHSEPANLRYGQGRGSQVPSQRGQGPIDPIQALLESNNMIARLLAEREVVQSRAGFDRNSRGPKVHMPDTFNGERTKVNNFITQCELYLSLRSYEFHGNEVTMIRWMIGFLRDTALNAVQPYLTHSAPPDWLTEKSKFFKHLRSSYGDPDERGTAERKLQSLVQKGSAAKYFSEFKQHSAILGWDDGPLIALAVRGLTEELKDLLAQRDHQVTTLQELTDIVIRLDNRLYARKVEKKSTHHTERLQPTTNLGRSGNEKTNDRNRSNDTRDSTQSRAPFGRGFDRSVPRQPHQGGLQTKPTSQPRGKLTDSEREHRYKNNLCLYCGQPGHIRENCPSATPMVASTNRTFSTSRGTGSGNTGSSSSGQGSGNVSAPSS